MFGFTAHGAHQWSKKQFVKPEFEVAKRMVGLLYFQVLYTCILIAIFYDVIKR